ncbi:MAG: hypothetical protein Q8P30_02770 [Candidatus Uhrbacteria bacterium]|nr:hypothetical protein [Candidatus Uhrbacteria bacterium]
MKTTSKLVIASLSFVLIGQGCLGFGGSTSSSGSGGMFVTADAGASWTQLSALPSASGVGSIGGVNVISIEIDPTDDATIYIGTTGNGMFFSYDNGVSWQRPGDADVREGAVLDIEVDPRNICTLYALKSDRILKSYTCSREFSSVYIETRSDELLTAFALDWFNPDIMWAGTSAGDILKSTDAGDNWSNVGEAGNDVSAIMISNADSRVVLVGTETRGMVRTDDSGETWVEFEDSLKKEFKASDDVYGFAQTENGDTILMNTKYGLLVSNDDGETWDGVPLVTSPGDVRIWGFAVDAKDGNTIYYGTGSIMYSTTSGGSSWSTEELPSSKAPYAMQAHPTNTDRIYTGFATVED